MNYIPYHEVRDINLLHDLVANMRAFGWQGRPLVADGDQLITGAHRYVAAQNAEITPDVIDIRDIYPDWDVIHADYDFPTIDERDYVAALNQLPADLRNAYGIDAH